MNKLEAVYFDLDGTLVDSAPDLAAAIDAMLEQLGRRKAGADNVRQWVGNGASVLVRRALAGQADWEPATPKDDALFNDALAMFYHAYENLNGQHAVLYDGVEECLTRLADHGCRMGICHQGSCRKTSGTVINRLTGKASGPGEETIQLCVSVPSGPVTVEL